MNPIKSLRTRFFPNKRKASNKPTYVAMTPKYPTKVIELPIPTEDQVRGFKPMSPSMAEVNANQSKVMAKSKAFNEEVELFKATMALESKQKAQTAVALKHKATSLETIVARSGVVYKVVPDIHPGYTDQSYFIHRTLKGYTQLKMVNSEACGSTSLTEDQLRMVLQDRMHFNSVVNQFNVGHTNSILDVSSSTTVNADTTVI